MAQDQQYNLGDLLHLMACLRHPEKGCPWDQKQSFASIAPHTLEEAYEVVEAIENQDWPHLEEELGDLLFQVVFYAQLGVEASYFDFATIIDGLVKKLIRRHPHVFPDGTLNLPDTPLMLSDEQIAEQWQAIKAEEKALQAKSGSNGMGAKDKTGCATTVLKDIPVDLPALTRAYKQQHAASRVGFDWDDPLKVLDQIEEELQEVREAIEQGDQQHIKEEVGDLLFAQVNLARHLNVDPESALRETHRKFERRFGYIEAQVLASGKAWEDFALEALENYWQDAKKRGL
ncbi:MAG: nucleoside triphosphate pyrophosphohydrolase [Pontibacterium sp.]